jgi:hypothetical protein
LFQCGEEGEERVRGQINLNGWESNDEEIRRYEIDKET